MNSLELSIDDLIPYIRNPRKNDEAATKVAASIKEFGFKQPIVVDKDMIIVAGHTRLLAAQKLGLKKVPVIIADDLTESQIKAYRIADNRVAEEAEWEYDLLKLELDNLVDLDFNIDLLGFNDEELESIISVVEFEPGTEQEQGKLDELDPKYVGCPHCGKEFDLREI